MLARVDWRAPRTVALMVAGTLLAALALLLVLLPVPYARLAPGILEELESTRKASRLTQAELAQRSGVNRMTVGRVESGLDPRLSTVQELARAMGMEIMLVPRELRSEVEGFRGFARYGLEDGDGRFEIVTVKPGPVRGPGETTQAPHIAVSLFARGMLNRVITRIYFADEEHANAADPVLARVPGDRRATLLAQPTGDGYAIDLRIQGDGETVFFSV